MSAPNVWRKRCGLARDAAGGALPPHVVGDRAGYDLRQRQNPFAIPLAADAQLPVLDDHVTEPQREDLGGAQPAQQHQVHEREIAIAPERAQELPDLGTREWLDECTPS